MEGGVAITHSRALETDRRTWTESLIRLDHRASSGSNWDRRDHLGPLGPLTGAGTADMAKGERVYGVKHLV